MGNNNSLYHSSASEIERQKNNSPKGCSRLVFSMKMRDYGRIRNSYDVKIKGKTEYIEKSEVFAHLCKNWKILQMANRINELIPIKTSTYSNATMLNSINFIEFMNASGVKHAQCLDLMREITDSHKAIFEKGFIDDTLSYPNKRSEKETYDLYQKKKTDINQEKHKYDELNAYKDNLTSDMVSSRMDESAIQVVKNLLVNPKTTRNPEETLRLVSPNAKNQNNLKHESKKELKIIKNIKLDLRKVNNDKLQERHYTSQSPSNTARNSQKSSIKNDQHSNLNQSHSRSSQKMSPQENDIPTIDYQPTLLKPIHKYNNEETQKSGKIEVKPIKQSTPVSPSYANAKKITYSEMIKKRQTNITPKITPLINNNSRNNSLEKNQTGGTLAKKDTNSFIENSNENKDIKNINININELNIFNNNPQFKNVFRENSSDPPQNTNSTKGLFIISENVKHDSEAKCKPKPLKFNLNVQKIQDSRIPLPIHKKRGDNDNNSKKTNQGRNSRRDSKTNLEIQNIERSTPSFPICSPIHQHRHSNSFGYAIRDSLEKFSFQNRDEGEEAILKKRLELSKLHFNQEKEIKKKINLPYHKNITNEKSRPKGLIFKKKKNLLI